MKETLKDIAIVGGSLVVLMLYLVFAMASLALPVAIVWYLVTH